jgi:hypothetical protein
MLDGALWGISPDKNLIRAGEARPCGMCRTDMLIAKRWGCPKFIAFGLRIGAAGEEPASYTLSWALPTDLIF